MRQVIFYVLLCLALVLTSGSAIATTPTQLELGKGVKVTFTPSPDARVIGHTLYVVDNNSAEIYPKSQPITEPTEFTFPAGSFYPGKIYTLYATAYDDAGNESEKSNSIEVTVPKGPAPPPDKPLPVYLLPGSPVFLKIEVTNPNE